MRPCPLPLLALLLAGTALPLAAILPAPAIAQATEYQLAIPRQPLPRALAALSQKTGLQVFYSGEATYGLSSNPVSGRYSVDQAVARMLDGTGAFARRVGSNGVTISVAGEAAPALGAAAAPGSVTLDTVVLATGATTEGSGSYASGQASIARDVTSLKELPQSVTVITRQTLEDQNLTTMEQAMAKIPGITTNREVASAPNFHARGFKINNYQIDGMGTAYESAFRPDFDMAIYDRVEVLRGAEGLFSGVGEPGGSVNLVRKRPTG